MEQGALTDLREAEKQQKKISYFAVYGQSKLEYKASSVSLQVSSLSPGRGKKVWKREI